MVATPALRTRLCPSEAGLHGIRVTVTQPGLAQAMEIALL